MAFAGQHAVGAEVVFGSFEQWEAAQALCDRVESSLSVDADIVGIEIRGVRHQRVVVAGFDTESAARAFMAKARRSGFPDAWYLAEPVVKSSLPAQTVPPPTESVAQTPDGDARPVEPVADTTRETEDAQPPERMPIRRFDGVLRFATTPAGDETFDVPRYDDVELQLDGRLDEAVWAQVPGRDNMVLVDPGTLARARHRTVARYLCTRHGLYIGVWNEQPRRTLVAQEDSRRVGVGHDAWGITLDTSGVGRHGHWFNIALDNTADREPATARKSGEGTWRYATAVLRDGWSLEAFLPWSALSLPRAAEEQVVGMYVNRRVAYLDERWGWPPSLTPTRNNARHRSRSR